MSTEHCWIFSNSFLRSSFPREFLWTSITSSITVGTKTLKTAHVGFIMQCFKKIKQKWLHVFHHLKYLYFFQLVYHFLKIHLPENWHNTCLYNSYYKFYVVSFWYCSAGTTMQREREREKWSQRHLWVHCISFNLNH